MNKPTDKSKIKKALGVASNILLAFFLLVCIFALTITLVGKKDVDGTAEIFGYQFRIVTSESMAKSEYTDVSDFKIKSIPVRSMILIETIPDDRAAAVEWYGDIKVGDVLTFRYVYETQVTITHRVISIEDNGDGGYIIVLEGDNKNAPSGQLTQTLDTSLDDGPNHVIGKVVGKSYIFGLFLSLIKSKLGIVLVILIPCLIIISFEVSKIVKVLTEDKKMREKAREDEISELRRQIAELKGQASTDSSQSKEDENE
jgi:hypothetical protein